MEKLPGVAAAYPDAHVKGIKIRYGDKEATAIGLAMPPEAALLGVADEILVAGRLFEEGDQPEAILGIQLAKNLGFKPPQEAIGAQITVEAAGLTPEGGEEFALRRKVLTVKIVGIYQAPALMPGSAQQGIFLPVELMKQIPGMYLESALNQLKAGGNPAAAGYASVTVRVRDPADLDGVEKADPRHGLPHADHPQQAPGHAAVLPGDPIVADGRGQHRPGDRRAGHREHVVDGRAGALPGDRPLQGDRGLRRRSLRALSHRGRHHRAAWAA